MCYAVDNRVHKLYSTMRIIIIKHIHEFAANRTILAHWKEFPPGCADALQT